MKAALSLGLDHLG